ncbi:MAG: hotdog domain-containing protein [Nocardioidaceae bacterium]
MPPKPSTKPTSEEHRVRYTVYYEDTDSLGVVYYANYFKFMERGRSEFVAARTGRPVQEWNAAGFSLVVHKVEATFRQGARLGDVVEVVSAFSVESPYRGRFAQRLDRAGTGEVFVQGYVDVVCLDAATGTLIELPAALRDLVP